MRILYGVCGEGFGHSSRAKEIIEHLKSRGHEIFILTYGQAYPILKEHNPLKIEGVHLSFDNGGLSLTKTLSANAGNLSKNIKNWNLIKKEIDNFAPEMCISDMEPLVPIIRRIYNLPLISVDNQHRITHLPLSVPKKYKRAYLIAKYAVQMCVAKADAFVILSFGREKTKEQDVFIVSPILRKEVVKLKPKKKNFILVYQTKKDRKLLNVLKQIDERFVVYGYDSEKQEGNLVFKKTGKKFVTDLANAKAVIATAGFTLMSEALYLKKPYFAIPLKGQFEQVLNSLFLEKAGFGIYSDNPKKKEIEKFICHLTDYEKKLKSYKTNPRECLSVFDKLIGRLR